LIVIYQYDFVFVNAAGKYIVPSLAKAGIEKSPMGPFPLVFNSAFSFTSTSAVCIRTFIASGMRVLLASS